MTCNGCRLRVGVGVVGVFGAVGVFGILAAEEVLVARVREEGVEGADVAAGVNGAVIFLDLPFLGTFELAGRLTSS